MWKAVMWVGLIHLWDIDPWETQLHSFCCNTEAPQQQYLVSGLTRPMSEKAGRVPEAVLWSVHSVCRQGWNESPHLQMSQYRHLWLSKLFRLLLQLSSTFFWGMVHLTNVWNRPKKSHVRSTYLSLLLFWVCFLEERVGGRSRLLPTLLHICKRLALTEPMRTLLPAEDRTQPVTTLPTAVDC